ncbi:MAG: hypothetical protein ACRDTV_11805 [Mycobacterium sp.]
MSSSFATTGSPITTAWPAPGKFTLMIPLPYRQARAAYIPCFEAKNAMAWMSFGIRGPGGSRTGSVVAVAISPLHAGTAKVFVPHSQYVPDSQYR